MSPMRASTRRRRLAQAAAWIGQETNRVEALRAFRDDYDLTLAELADLMGRPPHVVQSLLRFPKERRGGEPSLSGRAVDRLRIAAGLAPLFTDYAGMRAMMDSPAYAEALAYYDDAKRVIPARRHGDGPPASPFPPPPMDRMALLEAWREAPCGAGVCGLRRDRQRENLRFLAGWMRQEDPWAEHRRLYAAQGAR